jgi:hypothetical protein
MKEVQVNTEKVPHPIGLAAAREKVESNVLKSIKEEMPSELYDGYMTTMGRIPIWERTMMATCLMNYWGMDHCVRPNNKKPDKKNHHPLSKIAECGESVTQSQCIHVLQPGNCGTNVDQSCLHKYSFGHKRHKPVDILCKQWMKCIRTMVQNLWAGTPRRQQEHLFLTVLQTIGAWCNQCKP